MAGLSSSIQKAIVKEVRLLQQKDESIPWSHLSAKYRLSIDTLQSVFNQAEADSERRLQQSMLVARAVERKQLQSVLITNGPERRQQQIALEARAAKRREQQSVLVTRTVERHFDRILGQCNWESVANELDTPLVECLDLFDASNSTIQPRSLIEMYGGWSKTDIEKLKQFTADNYVDGSVVDWKLAGAYMNVHSKECQLMERGSFNGPINEVAYRRIREFRDSGQDWRDIHQHFMQYPKRKRMKDLIEQQLESTTIPELADIIKRELPNRPLSDIRLLASQYVNELKVGHLRLDQMARLRELVSEYDEDWDRIGEALGVLPSRAQHNWIKYGEDTDQLQGAESHPSCQNNLSGAQYSSSRQRDAALSGSHWTTADDETLLKMIDGSTMSAAAKWEQISKALDRSIPACKQRFTAVNHKQKVTDDCKSIVTSEVQKQLDTSGSVDWSQVSQATGLGVRECLELSLYDVGKAR
ncbi:hypothetical protein GGI17_003903 [Coemansia sp. S146]|nr:hypothetical protein GGI17_003903 [Coemansia sp. S146]